MIQYAVAFRLYPDTAACAGNSTACTSVGGVDSKDTDGAFNRRSAPWKGPRRVTHKVGRRAIIICETLRRNTFEMLHRQLTSEVDSFHLLADRAKVMMWTSGPDKLCDWFNRAWL